MNYSFQSLKVTDIEKKWLKEIASIEFSEVNFNALKVKFRDALRKGFDPDQTDPRLIEDGRLTLIGYWYIDPNHEILDHVSQSIEFIADLAVRDSSLRRVTASTISNKLDTSERRGEMVLRLIYDLPGFFKSGAMSDQIKYGMKQAEFHKNGKSYDRFLKFQNLDKILEEFFLSRSNVNTIRGQTYWPKVNRQLKKAEELLFNARSTEDFQNVGLCCRETLISLAQEVYDEQKHKTVDGKKPSNTDFKRMLNAYISAELCGGSNEELRSLVKKVKRVANSLQHKRTADNLDASLCVEATTSLIEMVKILEQGKKVNR